MPATRHGGSEQNRIFTHSLKTASQEIRIMLRVTLFAVVLSYANAGGMPTPKHDRIDALPGWDKSLPSAMYSGFIDATPEVRFCTVALSEFQPTCHANLAYYTPIQGETKNSLHMHYIFVESERDPSNDPVLVWSNGGPGAASEFGLFTELGPFTLSDQSLNTEYFKKSGIPSLFQNPYAWSKVANLLIYDSPCPVGYSYCGNNVSGDGYSCGNWDDFRTAKAAKSFMNNWAKAFTSFAKHDLYLSGESYAGVYIPMLAREILDDPSHNLHHNLKGMAIGDGCVGSDVLCGNTKSGPFFHVEFFHGHGQVSDKLYNKIIGTCGVKQLQEGVTDPECDTLLKEMDTQIGGFYGYNLYDECGAENVISSQQLRGNRNYWSSMPRIKGALNDYPCGGTGAMLKWLQSTAVKKALHVEEDATFFLSDNGVGFNYSLTEKNLMPFYQDIISNEKLRVLVYNGDTDPGINSFVSQNWTTALGFKESEAWRPWTLDGKQRMGGYVTRYDGAFDFLTIRGSGHMVPEFKPAAAFSFISTWLANHEYPGYAAPPAAGAEL